MTQASLKYGSAFSDNSLEPLPSVVNLSLFFFKDTEIFDSLICTKRYRLIISSKLLVTEHLFVAYTVLGLFIHIISFLTQESHEVRIIISFLQLRKQKINSFL